MGRRKRSMVKNEPHAAPTVPYIQNGFNSDIHNRDANGKDTEHDKSRDIYTTDSRKNFFPGNGNGNGHGVTDVANDSNNSKNNGYGQEHFMDQIDSDIIDISFLRRIVEADLNKKLSVLGDSEIVVTTQPIPLKATITKEAVEPFNDSYIDETFNEQDHETFSGSVEDESQSFTDSTPPPQTDEFTDKINEEVKSKYEKLSRWITDDKQRQIKTTINSIDKEINLLKLKYSHFKRNIQNLEKKTRLHASSRQRIKTIGTAVRSLNFKPSFYPELFAKKFKETEKKLQAESSLMSHLLAKDQTDKKINTEIITGRHISSFNENRESMKYFLREKIWRLDNELQRRVGGTEIVALANVAAMMDWSETNKLVSDAEKKLLEEDNEEDNEGDIEEDNEEDNEEEEDYEEEDVDNGDDQ